MRRESAGQEYGVLSCVHPGRQTEAQGKLFSILIPSWNNLPYLQLCLDSLQKHSRHAHQIIVIVNEGSDGTLEWVKARPDLAYVHAEHNIGICYALNAARHLIGTEYVMYANDDMYFLPGWDTSLWQAIQSIGHRGFMISSTLIEPHSHDPCRVVADFGTDLKSFHEADLLAASKTLSRADWSGASWPPNVMAVDTWDLVGGMSTEFSPGLYSDPDLACKLYQAGVRVFIGKGDSLVYHFSCKSTGRIALNDGRKTFLLKWGLSARTFNREYLRLGGPAPDSWAAEAPRLSTREKLNQKLKKLLAALR